MHRSLLFTIALVAVVLAGCSKDSENMEIFTIDTESISLLVNDDYKITPSGVFTARSSDEDVATVSADGVIHGVSAGNADIIFTSVEDGQTQTCKVSVDWRYHYFEEPVIAFGATKEEIKERETHEVIRERDNYIVYEYPNEEMMMSSAYTFDNNGALCEIGLSVSNREMKISWEDDILRQLSERYGDYSEVDGDKIFKPKNGGYRIRIVSHRLNIFYTLSSE